LCMLKHNDLPPRLRVRHTEALMPGGSPARTVPSGRWLRPKNFVFGFVAAMTAYVLYHNERFLIQPANPVWQHYQKIAWGLLPHGIAGACALLLAPMQFSDRLRKRYASFHRVVGRVYVAGVMVLAPLGAYIQYFEERLGDPRTFTVLAIVDAVLLMSTTAIAFLFATKRRITQHRQWMTRSYAVALVFFEGRFFSGVMGLDDASVEVNETVIWSCLALALLFAEVANHWSEIRSALSMPARARATAHREAVYGVEEPTA
jgi:uncharacterized membrane protein